MSRDILARLILSVIIGVLIFTLHRTITTGPRPNRPTLDAGRFLVLAHRGGAALAPENTLAAFRNADRLGADILHLDARLTADKQLVAMHDATLDRTTNGTGEVSNLSLSELRQLDAGYQFTPDGGASHPFRGQGVTVPTLQDVLAAFPTRVIAVELQDDAPEAAEALVQVIQSAEAENRIIVASAHDRVLRQFRRLAPNVATAVGPGEFRLFSLLQRLGLLRLHRPLGDVYVVPTLGDEASAMKLIASARRLNQKVVFQNVDAPADVQRLQTLGADGVLTDRPDLALGVVQRQ